jgi:hypothetical protein
MNEGIRFHLGQVVYSALDDEDRGLVTGILFRPAGHVYYVTWGATKQENLHYDFELKAERDFAQPGDGGAETK